MYTQEQRGFRVRHAQSTHPGTYIQAILCIALHRDVPVRYVSTRRVHGEVDVLSTLRLRRNMIRYAFRNQIRRLQLPGPF